MKKIPIQDSIDSDQDIPIEVPVYIYVGDYYPMPLIVVKTAI